MSNNLTFFHLTTEDVWYEILKTGELLPRSCISDFSKHEWMKMAILPSCRDGRGVFGIIDYELFKWKENVAVWKYFTESWIQFHGEDKPRFQLKRPVMLEFEVEINKNISVFEEANLFRLADKWWLANSFIERFYLMLRWKKYATGFVNSKIPITEYHRNYQLPSVFIPHSIPVSDIYHKIFEIGEDMP